MSLEEIIKLRKAELSDIDILNEFQHEIGLHERPLDHYIKREGRIRQYTNEELTDAINSNNSLVLIAEMNQKPVGCGLAGIKENNGSWSRFSHKGYVGMMFVKKDYRSKGIGSFILNELLGWLKKKKIEDIRLQVYRNNGIAIDAYLKAGFKDYIREMVYRPD